MKLTNSMRKAFVRSAMDDVPKVDYVEAIRSTAVAAVLDALPKIVRQVWDDTKTRDFIRTRSRSFGGVSVQVPCITKAWNDSGDVEISAKAQKTIADLEAKCEAQEATRNELERKLRGAAFACNTRKALAELLPEFEKYLPADEPAAIRTLPVVANIVSDFVKAGWPKGKKPAKAAA